MSKSWIVYTIRCLSSVPQHHVTHSRRTNCGYQQAL